MQSFQSKETKSDERPLRLLFLLSRFLDGGIDTVLLEYVNHLADHLHYDVTLGIAICYGDLEVYRPKLSQRVKVVYFNQSPFLDRQMPSLILIVALMLSSITYENAR